MGINNSHMQYKYTNEQLEEMKAQMVAKQNENNFLNAKCEALSKQLSIMEANAVSSQAKLNNRERELTELQAIKAKNEQEKPVS
jgi:regulator of replication initiation timing